jgi:predicted nucleotidyltransferase
MSFESLTVEDRRKRLEEELKRLIPKLKGLGVRKVILFGSLARGDVGRSSDIDLIIVQETEKRFLDRLEEIYTALQPKVALDVLVYTPEEFVRMERTSPFIRSILKKGRVLYDATESQG